MSAPGIRKFSCVIARGVPLAVYPVRVVCCPVGEGGVPRVLVLAEEGGRCTSGPGPGMGVGEGAPDWGTSSPPERT